MTKLPGNQQHLQRLLDQWAQTHAGIGTGRLTQLVGITVVAALLEDLRDVDGMPQVGFKGGSAMVLRFGFQARATRDLDAAFRGDFDEAFELIASAMRKTWNEFTARCAEPEEITRADIFPPPFRLKIKLFYKGKPFTTIPFEISAAEGSSMDKPETVVPAVSLAPVQIGNVREIVLLPIRYQVAQKLHACTEPSDDDMPNQRVRDLADLMLIRELAVAKVDLSQIHQACKEIFHSRSKHVWPPRVEVAPGWQRLWASLSEQEHLEMALEDAVYAVQEFIDEIARADDSDRTRDDKPRES